MGLVFHCSLNSLSVNSKQPQTLKEIVDLELIAPLVFTADVVPIILIAEKRPPKAEDKIRLRVADQRCAKFTGFDKKHIVFDLDKTTSVEMPYADVFSADGRILTRLTPERKSILDKFEGSTLADIAQTFWVGKSKSTIMQWSLEEPADKGELRWEEADMIRMGAAFRGSIHKASSGGKDIYKGANITACRREGDPVEKDIDVSMMDDSSLWRFADILPDKGFAFHRISTALTSAPFDPEDCVFLNTATLFFPTKSLAQFPFDFLVLSKLYQYYFALSQREALLFRARCNVYPTTVRRLPWSNKLADSQKNLIELRENFINACQNLHNREEVLLKALLAQEYTTFKELVTETADAKVDWSEEIEAGKKVFIKDSVLLQRDGLFVVQPADDLLHWIAINNQPIAECFIEGLALHQEMDIGREVMLEMPIPTIANLNEWKAAVAKFDKTNYEKSIDAALDKLDNIVAKAFKLTANDVDFVKKEFQEDGMLRRVRPNLPFTDRRVSGLRKGLAESDRYQKAYKTRG